MSNIIVVKKKSDSSLLSNVVIVKKNSDSFLSQENSNITIRNNTNLQSFVPKRLDELLDVVEINPQNNSTLVYDSLTDKYIVKELDIDGGEF